MNGTATTWLCASGLISGVAPAAGTIGLVKVWIDQDLCTGDGLCVDHCPEIFVLLEDGIAYVRDGMDIGNDPGGAGSIVPVAPDFAEEVVAAADDCPGECIFIEIDPRGHDF